MFLLESCKLFRKTEPKFFSILRLLTALFFSCALGYYIWISFDEFISEINTENFKFITYPKFTICLKTLSDSNNNSALRIISLYKLYYNDSDFQLYFANESSYVGNNYKPTGMLKFYPNMTNYLYNNSLIPKRTYVNKLNHRCMTFIPQNEFVRHPYYERHPLLFVITLDTNSSIYDYFEIVFKSFYTATKFDINEKIKLGFNERFLTPGRYYKYTFNYKYTKYYSNPLSGLFGFDADDGDMNIVIEDNVLAQIPNSTFNTVNTVLELSHYYNIIVNDDIMTFKNNVVKLIENFGGFYGAISGIFVLLFGASKLSPWGICQIHLLRCWPCRRRFKERLASRYVSRAGIPLVEDPYNLPENGRIEDRVAILEILLKEYYIDDYYLDELRKTREKYIRILGDENA